MNKKIKDMTDEELKKLLKMSSRQVGSTIRSKMIIEELIKRTLNQNKDKDEQKVPQHRNKWRSQH